MIDPDLLLAAATALVDGEALDADQRQALDTATPRDWQGAHDLLVLRFELHNGTNCLWCER